MKLFVIPAVEKNKLKKMEQYGFKATLLLLQNVIRLLRNDVTYIGTMSKRNHTVCSVGGFPFFSFFILNHLSVF